MAARQIMPIDDDIDLGRLSQLCLPCWDDGKNTGALLPDRPEYGMLMQAPVPPNARWTRVLRQLQAAICVEGESSLNDFLDKLHARYSNREDNPNRVLQSVGAMLTTKSAVVIRLRKQPRQSSATQFQMTVSSNCPLLLHFCFATCCP
jgi:hypothetical protein